MRYSRQILLPDFDLEKQEKLINSSAIIIGLGGLGCSVSQYLAAAGIGKLTLVDDDTVELTNLQRQILHFEKDLGLSKVASAQDTLNQINSHTVVQTHSERLSENKLAELFKEHDIVIDCSDNLSTRNSLNKLAYKSLTPLVSGAAIRMEGQVFCVIPTEGSSCYKCLSRFFGEQNLSCLESGVMSPLVGTIGSVQATEAIKILTQYGCSAVNILQVYDAMESNWSRFNVTPFEACEVCGSQSVV